MKIIVNNKEFEIKEQYVHKQSDAYYKALEEGTDAYKIHMLYQPPTMRSFESIQRVVNIITLNETYLAELERIENASAFELEMDIKNDYRPIRDFKFWK
mgnify:CR=1 FL=1